MLTFGGKPLLFDPDGAIQQHIDAKQPLAGSRVFASPAARADGRAAATNTAHVSIAFPNFPAPPSLKLNQLYWPTGASRWAFGFFLMAQKHIDELSSTSGTMTFEAKHQDGTTFSTSLYLLESRPMASLSGSASIVVLVDERYFWQFKNVGDTAAQTSWSGIFTATGLASSPTVESGYLKPDTTELLRRYENAALVLDAASHSLGKRVIRKPSGTVEVMAPADSQTRYDAQKTAAGTRIAGATIAAPLAPAQVQVIFPKIANGCQPTGRTVYAKTADAPSTVASVTGMTKTIYTTCWADYSTGSFDNQSNCDNLAAQIGSDYYAWLARAFDATYAGIVDWTPTGFDDHTLYDFGRTTRPQPGEVAQSTRVQSLPVNFGPESQLSQDQDVVYIGEHAIGVLDETLVYQGTANVSIYTGSQGSESDSGDTIKTGEWCLASGESLASGTRVVVLCVNGLPYVTQFNVCPS